MPPFIIVIAASGEGFAPYAIAMRPSDVEEPGVTGFQYYRTKPINCDHLCSSRRVVVTATRNV